MSFVNDVRTRAEGALDQGKQALENAQKSAQTRLADAVGTATSVAEKAASRDVTVAGRTVSFDTLVSELEDLVKRYRDSADKAVAELKSDDRIEKLVETAESLLNEIRRDKRVTQLVQGAETIYEALYETVQDRVVKPTKGLIAKTPAAKITPAKAPVKVTTPAAPATKAPATKAPVKKASPAKATPAKAAVKKAPAKKAPANKATPAKAAVKKAPAKKASS